MTADPARETTAIVVVVVDARHRRDLDGDEVVATWPFDHADPPCLGDVDRLARMQLAARRMGLRVRVVRPTAGLTSLLGSVGLTALLDPG